MTEEEKKYFKLNEKLDEIKKFYFDFKEKLEGIKNIKFFIKKDTIFTNLLTFFKIEINSSKINNKELLTFEERGIYLKEIRFYVNPSSQFVKIDLSILKDNNRLFRKLIDFGIIKKKDGKKRR